MSEWTKAAGVVLAVGICGSAHAQTCEGQWLPGYGVPGVNGSVNAMALWDPDGDGPRPEALIIGGGFSMVDKTSARNLAMWDGQQWSEIGGGTSGAVKALAVYQGKLCVGGSFSTAGGVTTGRLAVWDGATWIGGGTEPTTINALQVYQGELVAAGGFVLTGAGTPIAKWNGATWSFLGTNSAIGSGINALTVFEGKLIAGGSFTSAGGQSAGGIASWDGAWTALGSGVNATKAVRALAVYQGQLFAGGNFSSLGGVSARFLGRWNGTQWENPGLPVSSGGLSPAVNALTIFEGKLIVGGDTTIYRVNTWDGVSWGTLGQWFEGAVLSLQPFNGSLFAGTEGSYHSTATGRGLVEYHDGKWEAIATGYDDVLRSMAQFGDKLVVSGNFDQMPGIEVDAIAQWNGAAWASLGSNPPLGSSNALRTFHGLLYSTGLSSLNPLSTWNGEVWATVPGLASSSRINSLSGYEGDLLAVGRIALSGGSGSGPVAAWDGNQWRTFGTDLIGEAISAVEFEGDLVVSGSPFTLRLTTDPSARGIFRYDGNSWHAWPVSLSNSGVLAVYQGKLMVGSTDVRDTGAVSYGSLAQWEGDRWASVGGGISSASGGGVVVLKEFNNSLIVGGNFNLAGGNPVSNIVRWDGSAWHSMGGGVSGGRVVDVQQFHDELVAIGEFTKAGGQISAYFARWTDNPTPWVAVSPESKPVNEGLTLTLSAASASGYTNVSFQWKRNGVDVNDGPGGASAGGGTVSGASGTLASPSDGASVSLIIAGVQASDAGDYTIEFDNTCNTATSSIATVSVNTCPGDLNADGFVNDTDFGIFATAYDTLMCDAASMPIGCLSDWNGDGVVDDADFQVFVVAYGTMVCE